MLRSLFAGVSGMRNHQVRMDVIGNNIANVNTVSFKAGRVDGMRFTSEGPMLTVGEYEFPFGAILAIRQ